MQENKVFKMLNQPFSDSFADNYTAEQLFTKIPKFSELKKELRWSVQILTAYKLYNSAKWAGELLQAITKDNQATQSSILNNFIQANTDHNYKFDKVYVEDVSDDCADALMLARSLFDLKEYKKCAHTLKEFIEDKANQPAIFLHYYSLYLSGEIRKEEELFENDQNSKMVVNQELKVIERGLEKLFQQGALNEMNQYLYGLIMKHQQEEEKAKIIFVNILNNFPCFWSVWLELNNLIQGQTLEILISGFQGDHWMHNFYFSSYYLEKYKNNVCIELNYNLLCFFKNSTYLMNQIAHSFYNSQDFEISLEWFEKLVDIDPYRFENMDTYSNILYIKENQGELSNLALRCFYNNKYAPETSCVVGLQWDMKQFDQQNNFYQYFINYKIFKTQHLEMKNIPGAIEAYRNAVEIDPRDFRAWYGLGQTYELQNMYHYALYYFARAVMSRPRDARMWNAIGQCYDRMNKANEAVKCYERAENAKDKEGIALHQLGKLYALMEFEEKAFKCFQENLQRKDNEQIVDKELGECLIYLANYYKKQQNYSQAQIYAQRLLDFIGPESNNNNNK
ncbi:hypothetical protein PPERSA_04091 [Pseudocohnilembus persalinus]|uniref:Cdc23 domain-containing protein n=1 Tax=Pseudocohnilembus persalinus TaxID=266149 RepID=A0A0V0QLC6_PSEPJ|nr:hypothetical protein PPERSA_04091 [Pseudocohnilembus persalinus]|eukprot:KRX02888.1 hypothetical protein PPERSA_04091 [Pseudocohnilembus persalinus]